MTGLALPPRYGCDFSYGKIFIRLGHDFLGVALTLTFPLVIIGLFTAPRAFFLAAVGLSFPPMKTHTTKNR